MGAPTNLLTPASQGRIGGLDFLRGVAIIIMFIDHLTIYTTFEQIAPFNVRFFTRLAAPLFAIIFGYFLARPKMDVLGRMLTLLPAVFIVNIFFWPVLSVLDILASFTLALVAYLAFSEYGVIAISLIFMLMGGADPTMNFLDYPLFVFLPLVSIGLLLKKDKNASLFALAAFLAAAALLNFPAPYNYTAYFALPAYALVVVFEGRKNFKMPFLNFVGARPVVSYVAQFVIAISLALLYHLYLKPLP